MIELNKTGACKDCQYIELDLDYICEGPRKHYTCRCVHQDVCGLIKDEQLPDEIKLTKLKIPLGINGDLLERALDPDWQKAHMDMGLYHRWAKYTRLWGITTTRMI